MVDKSAMLVYDGAGIDFQGDEIMGKAFFAARLRQIRADAGLSQYGLGKKTGLTRQAIYQLERGQSEPTWTTVQLFAAALGVDYAVFADPALKLPDAGPVQPRGRPRKAAPSENKPVKNKSAPKKKRTNR